VKPSDFVKEGELPPAAKDIPANLSRDAYPPISARETKSAPVAVCRWHGGLIKRSNSSADHGKVFYCPEGGQYWRFPDPAAEAKRHGKPVKFRKIDYDNRGIV
jgi:hypothetical protein